MLTCGIHACTFPEGYTCPACQREDAAVNKLQLKVLSLEKKVERLEERLAEVGSRNIF